MWNDFNYMEEEIKKYLDKPDWQLEIMGITKAQANKIWTDKTENSSQASWALLVANHFLKKIQSQEL